jgi:hypothetical protein
MIRLAARTVYACTLVLALPAAGLAGEPAPGTLYGSTGNVGGALITIDPATGDGTLVGPINDLGPVTEIEFRADGVLFGATGAGTSNIITIDPLTGDETLVGQHGIGAVNGLEFVGGTLYGSYFAPPPPLSDGNGPPLSFLVTVDQTDGSLTIIGPITDYFPVRGLAYDVAGGTMYGIGGVLLPATNPEGVGDVLFTIDLATAATTEIGPTGFFLGSIEFGPDGTLYGGADGGGQLAGGVPGAAGWASPGPREAVGGSGAQLVTIDPATGAAAAVGPTGFPAISGLSFAPEGGPSVLEIPALSWLGLALLALLLAGAGLAAVRRG